MLKNGTLLKVSPELIQALKNALDVHYMPLIQQAAKKQRRQLPTEEVADLDYPFKVTVSGDTCTIAGGYVIGYDTAVYLRDQKINLSLDGALFFYIAVRPDVGSHTISAEIEITGKKEYRENGVYYFPLAEWKEDEDKKHTLIQFQFGNLVTPFRRNYIPVIKDDLKCLLEVKEGEGDEMLFMVRSADVIADKDNPDADGTIFAPKPNQHLVTDGSNKLRWEHKSGVEIHKSLAKLITINDDGELELSGDAEAGAVLAVNSGGNEVEWISVGNVGSGEGSLGVITVEGKYNGYGTAKWKPVKLDDTGAYVVADEAEEQTVIIPRQ